MVCMHIYLYSTIYDFILRYLMYYSNGIQCKFKSEEMTSPLYHVSLVIQCIQNFSNISLSTNVLARFVIHLTGCM